MSILKNSLSLCLMIDNLCKEASPMICEHSRALVVLMPSLHITNKDRYQNKEHPRTLASLNSPKSQISPTFRQTCSGTKLFEILMILLKDFFENVHFEKFSRQRNVSKKLLSMQIQLNLCKTGTQK